MPKAMHVKTQVGKIKYTDTAAKTIATLPKDARLLKIVVDKITAFNSSGTDLLDIGTVADNARFVNDLDVSAAGMADATLLDGGKLGAAGPVLDIVGKYIQSIADATAGEADIYVIYADPFNH